MLRLVQLYIDPSADTLALYLAPRSSLALLARVACLARGDAARLFVRGGRTLDADLVRPRGLAIAASRRPRDRSLLRSAAATGAQDGPASGSAEPRGGGAWPYTSCARSA